MMPMKGQRRREEGFAGRVSGQGVKPTSGKGEDAGLGSGSDQVSAHRTRGSRASIAWQRNLVQGRQDGASDPTHPLGWAQKSPASL